MERLSGSDGGVLMGPEAGRVRDREDRFLAAFDCGVDGLAFEATPAWRSEREWAARIRACLAVLLERLDEDRALGRLVFVEALCAGPRVLARRTLVLGELAEAIDEGRAGHQAQHEIPPLAAEGAVGAAFWLIHARLCDPRAEGSLVELLDPLMAMIVLPYRGPAAACLTVALRCSVEQPSGWVIDPQDADRSSGSGGTQPGGLGRRPSQPWALSERHHPSPVALAEVPALADRRSTRSPLGPSRVAPSRMSRSPQAVASVKARPPFTTTFPRPQGVPQYRRPLGEQIKDAGSEMCFSHERPRTLSCEVQRASDNDGASVNTQPLHFINRPADFQPAGRRR